MGFVMLFVVVVVAVVVAVYGIVGCSCVFLGLRLDAWVGQVRGEEEGGHMCIAVGKVRVLVQTYFFLWCRQCWLLNVCSILLVSADQIWRVDGVFGAAGSGCVLAGVFPLCRCMPVSSLHPGVFAQEIFVVEPSRCRWQVGCFAGRYLFLHRHCTRALRRVSYQYHLVYIFHPLQYYTQTSLHPHIPSFSPL